MWKYALITLMVSSAAFATDISTKHIVLRGVDKVTGRMSTMQAGIGDVVSFGDLKIVADKCLTRSPEEAPENSAYLEITEKLKDGSFKEIFNGWMFSSNPALSAMEHPVYDIWVLSCTNGGKVSTPVVNSDTSIVADTVVEDEVMVEDDNPSLGDEVPADNVLIPTDTVPVPTEEIIPVE